MISDSAAPIVDRTGQIIGVVLVFRDVLEQRRTERVLRNNERLATTGRLAATTAHEIHNPVASALGNSGAARASIPSPIQRSSISSQNL